jgi:hypothetical protein
LTATLLSARTRTATVAYWCCRKFQQSEAEAERQWCCPGRRGRLRIWSRPSRWPRECHEAFEAVYPEVQRLRGSVMADARFSHAGWYLKISAWGPDQVCDRPWRLLRWDRNLYVWSART